jgi:Transcriptional regulator
MSLHINDILYIKTIAEERSFSKAAKKLLISQPALSQTVQRLEQRFGVEFFIRKNNAVFLTPAGEAFVRDGSKILELSEQLTKTMNELSLDNESVLRIGSSWFFSSFQLCKIIAEFQKQNPNVKLEIVESLSRSAEEMVLNGELDLCLVPLPLSHKMLKYVPLAPERICFAVAKNHPLNEYAENDSSKEGELPTIDLSLARNEPFIFLKTIRFQDMQFRICREAGFEPYVAFRAMNWLTVMSFIREGLGVGFLPETLIKITYDNFAPMAYRINYSETDYLFAIAYRNNINLSETATRFIKLAQSIQ